MSLRGGSRGLWWNLFGWMPFLSMTSTSGTSESLTSRKKRLWGRPTDPLGAAMKQGSKKSRRSLCRAMEASSGLNQDSNLNLSTFSKEITVPAIRLDARHCSDVHVELRKHLLNLPNLKIVRKDPDDPSKRRILLASKDVEEGDNLRSMIRNGSNEHMCGPDDVHQNVQRFAEKYDGSIVSEKVLLTHHNLGANEMMRELLPENVTVPTGFQQIGHIAHLNLKEEHFPFKHLIAQVILLKSAHIKTVVNKVGQIDNKLRVPEFEVLAGTPNMSTEVKQHDLVFKLDYSKVYWNSRLDHEREVLVEGFKPDDEVWDVFAGIGPFALVAAMKGCNVFANDLNPESHQYCKVNYKLNERKFGGRCAELVAQCSNLDAREFIRTRMTEHLAQGARRRVHVIMNLPASSSDFLDAFDMNINSLSTAEPPTIHLYCFSKDDDPKTEIHERASSSLGRAIPKESVSLREVRLVAPNKKMFCFSFPLPL